MLHRIRKATQGTGKRGGTAMAEGGEATAAVRAAQVRSQKKSLKLYFDDIVAGEPSDVVKNNELVVAAAFGDIARVTELVTSGADVHTGNDRPLQVAAANGQTETVKYLLENKANAQADDNEPLIEAARSGYEDVVDLLLRYGADVHARNDESLRLASRIQVQTPASFNARRPTPPGGHAKTLQILRARVGRPTY